ncbi:hypothetical protein [Nevskia ramosa]|uniref:hypothetical protein n=1 Tax=Nevskia ramosa TaxID=64002 RepID=UPI003D12DA7A
MESFVVKKVQRVAAESESAEVTLASSVAELVAFCFPCDLVEGQVIPNMLHGMTQEAQAAYLNDWPDDLKASASVERLERVGTFGYVGCGKVLDHKSGMVEVLGFKLQLENLSCNGVVEFKCTRIDI